MASKAKFGTHWQSDELDAIVADYFAMLAANLSGQRYVKSSHSKGLMARIGRTHHSIEFKYQNISAVLDELGLPWIPGYRPKRNYQSAIFDAIDRYLTKHSDVLESVPISPTPPALPTEIFVAPPPLVSVPERIPEGLKRLVRKFDPVARDHRNRSLGKAGEEFVYNLERRRLAAVGRSDLSQRVRWVAAEEGDGAGYDVLSFNTTGGERLLEVKTTNGSARTPFFLTRNECDVAKERPEDWCIYRVHLFAREPRIFTISPPLELKLDLHAELWRASFYSRAEEKRQ
ncbi:DUF3883 domain-containing protein [Candidatus Binatus soli]|jgi:hypothetical protein|uniref:DUF3883 domain-containing protein n=1 Tax=Candidatus Binatus soli TaxID=1953413 RepID=UPI003D0D2740